MPARKHARTPIDLPEFQKAGSRRVERRLALALAIDEKYDYANPFWQHAKFPLRDVHGSASERRERNFLAGLL